ncbi:MAG: ergothioneine biosynthesis protein EgtB [Thermoguttaceae bacterium]
MNPLATTKAGPRAAHLARHYRTVRAFTERLCRPLLPEDCVIQSMPDVSPTRWHLAHTTWFFETFILGNLPTYFVFHPQYNYLFNSYYNAVGPQFPRSQRGLLSRPGLDEVYEYREYVDSRILRALDEDSLSPEQQKVVELGIHHEQQHQELILTDIKHVLSCNPLHPSYDDGEIQTGNAPEPCGWTEIAEGIHRIGHQGDRFAYDNESPRHQVFLESAALADRLVTCGEYLEFIKDGGYERPELWLSQGWNLAREQGWEAPLYWTRRRDTWHLFTLAGLKRLDPSQPVCHVSYFEADAFATWAGARLPTEYEWETAAAGTARDGVFADVLLDHGKAFHPQPEPATGQSLFGNVWQWTASPYTPYAGYRPSPGALGEYNGKFMCNQFVLRGGSCATSADHIRATYRNFFPPDARWQFSGIRLAR